MPKLSIVIQAGGESRRMGQDKGLINFLGKPLIERVIERISPIADELLVTTNYPQRYQFLDIRLQSDLKPGRGALGGLYTALSAARHPLVGVVACDMPFVNAGLLEAERDIIAESNWDVVIPDSGDGLQPFHAVYRRQTCLPAISRALRDNLWKVDSWFIQVNVRYLDKEKIVQFDPSLSCFFNINTTEDLQTAVQIADRS